MTLKVENKSALPWNGQYIWQPLRRAAAYRTLFAEYEDWANSEVTGRFAKAFETLRALKPGFAGIWCVPSMKEPYPEVHQRFLRLYGDVLLFPFPPDIADPPADLIAQFVLSEPATVDEPACSAINDEGDIQGPKNAIGAGITYQSLELNLNHSDEMIVREAESQIREVLSHYRSRGRHPIFVKSDGRNQSWNWELLQLQMTAWDEHQRSVDSGIKPSFIEICKTANPTLTTESGNASQQADSWGRQAVKQAGKLIQLFERPAPDRH